MELKEGEFFHSKVFKNSNKIKEVSDVIVANRMIEFLRDINDKVYVRHLFGND